MYILRILLPIANKYIECMEARKIVDASSFSQFKCHVTWHRINKIFLKNALSHVQPIVKCSYQGAWYLLIQHVISVSNFNMLLTPLIEEGIYPSWHLGGQKRFDVCPDDSTIVGCPSCKSSCFQVGWYILLFMPISVAGSVAEDQYSIFFSNY